MQPLEGSTLGNYAVRLTGDGFAATLAASFDGLPARTLLVTEQSCYVQPPPHAAAAVNVNVCQGNVVLALPWRYRYHRPRLVGDSQLTRLVRSLLQNLKAHYLANTSITVDINAADPVQPGVAFLARLPALVLTGPDVQESRVQMRNDSAEETDADGGLVEYGPSFSADLTFRLTGASHSTVEMLNMQEAAVSYLHQAKWVSLDIDVNFPELGQAHWPIHIEDAGRASLDLPDGVKSFSLSFSVRGFHIGGSSFLSASPKAKDATIVVQGN